jgi:hypothetical protein
MHLNDGARAPSKIGKWLQASAVANYPYLAWEVLHREPVTDAKRSQETILPFFLAYRVHSRHCS